MIHKTSIIQEGAKISDNVEIGPYCVIGANVSIESKTKIHSHVSIIGNTSIGSGNEISIKKPKLFLEVGVFHGVTARNVCDLLFKIHGNNFQFTGIDLFEKNDRVSKDELVPRTKFNNPLKTLYYKYIVKLDPYTIESVYKLLKKYKNNINIIKGDSNRVLK